MGEGSGVSQTWILLPVPQCPSWVSLGSSITSLSFIFVPPWSAAGEGGCSIKALRSPYILSYRQPAPHPHPCFSWAGGVTALNTLGGKSAIFLDSGSLAYSTPRFLPRFPAGVPQPSDSALVVRTLGSPAGTSAIGPGTYSAQGPLAHLSLIIFTPSPASPTRPCKSGMSPSLLSLAQGLRIVCIQEAGGGQCRPRVSCFWQGTLPLLMAFPMDTSA